jgi:hypothetical protein
MTEYELVDATASMAMGAMGAISLYLTTLTAYIIAAFIVGEKLTRGEMLVTSSIFLCAALLFAYVTVGFLMRQMYFAERIKDIQTDAFLPVGPTLPIVLAVVQLVGIVVGLKFMWDVRNRKIR